MEGNPRTWNKLNDIEDNVDLIFIDGDHTYPTCLEDFKLAWKKIRVGGVIILHDVYSWIHYINKLINYVKTIPNANLKMYRGEDGMGVVTKMK